MKRSFVNSIIQDAIDFLQERRFFLPEWAYWKLDDWKKNVNICDNIFKHKLGWDIFNPRDDFLNYGGVLFTIRNGSIENNVRPYCEKIIVIQEEQILPYHHHKFKTEDIINRGGGTLCLKLIQFDSNDNFTPNSIITELDAIEKEISKEGEVILKEGQSITLYPYCSHQIFSKEGKILIGEVSKVNDDETDNFFIDATTRFPNIEEDEAIIYPTIVDYTKLK